MLCPKCHMEQEDRNLLCDYCGLVFAKQGALREATPIQTKVTVYAPAATAAITWLRDRLFTPQPVASRVALAARAALLLGLGVWGARLIYYSIQIHGAGESLNHHV